MQNFRFLEYRISKLEGLSVVSTPPLAWDVGTKQLGMEGVNQKFHSEKAAFVERKA